MTTHPVKLDGRDWRTQQLWTGARACRMCEQPCTGDDQLCADCRLMLGGQNDARKRTA